ncbi:MAG: ribose 5-phosphate isomerase A [Acidimicrobiales bacterium]
MSNETAKQAVADAASLLAADGMRLGLGTGTTVRWLLPALARRGLDLVCVATSRETEQRARELGLDVQGFDRLDRLDLAIDGADQVTPDGWLVKGGGGAHTREKVVAAAAERFVVIVSEDKLVERVTPPVPLELLGFGLQATLRALGDVALRAARESPDGGIIADWLGEVDSPRELAGWLAGHPGVVDHGLFPPEMVTTILVGSDDGQVRTLAR